MQALITRSRNSFFKLRICIEITSAQLVQLTARLPNVPSKPNIKREISKEVITPSRLFLPDQICSRNFPKIFVSPSKSAYSTEKRKRNPSTKHKSVLIINDSVMKFSLTRKDFSSFYVVSGKVF